MKITNELDILAHAVQTIYFPRIIKTDQKTFVEIAAGLGLNTAESNPADQLFELAKNHHALSVVGPATADKTALVEAAAKKLGELNKIKYDIIKVDVTVPAHELFGSLDVESNEWTDGTFTNALRNSATS